MSRESLLIVSANSMLTLIEQASCEPPDRSFYLCIGPKMAQLTLVDLSKSAFLSDADS